MCKPVQDLPATKWDHLDPLIPSRRDQYLADLAVADAASAGTPCSGPKPLAVIAKAAMVRCGALSEGDNE